MIAYVRMLALRWLRRPWGTGALWSMVLLPVMLGCTVSLRTEMTWMTMGSWARDTLIFCMAMAAIGFVAFILAATVQEERVEGRGSALRVAGIDGLRLTATLAGFGVLMSLVLAFVSTASIAVVCAVLSVPGRHWAAIGFAQAAGSCAMVPMLLVVLLSLPSAIGRSLAAPIALGAGAVTGEMAIEAADAGLASVETPCLAAVVGLAIFTVLPLVWSRFPARNCQ